MAENKSSNPKQACVDCHFFRVVMLEMLLNSNKYIDVEARPDDRERFKKKDYTWIKDTEKPHIMVGLGCSEGCWKEEADPNKYKETDWENLSDKEAIDLGDNAHADFIEERHKRMIK